MSEAKSEDFRSRFYERYVSQFKQTNAQESQHDRDAFARWSDARYRPYFNHLPNNAAILDLGCGHGRMLRYLRTSGYANVHGIDISAEQCAIAVADGLRAEEADIFEYLKTHPEEFDLIIAIDVVEHFTKDELLTMFDLVNGALKPNGTVLLQTANGEGLFPGHIMFGDLTHSTIFNPGSMEQLLKLTGFDLIRFSETAPLANGAKGELRVAAWSVITGIANLVRQVECGKTQAIWTENFITAARKSPTS
jgi:2-polyprenyl-3-methyl-5-hydroxy-6-metoxy-1,4-benzoquinol methylase